MRKKILLTLLTILTAFVLVSSIRAWLFTLDLPRFFTSKAIKIVASTKAVPSATGPAYKIPINPNIFERIIIAGIKMITCLDSDNTALSGLFPIAWKKLPDGICIPLQMQSIKYILKLRQANSI